MRGITNHSIWKGKKQKLPSKDVQVLRKSDSRLKNYASVLWLVPQLTCEIWLHMGPNPQINDALSWMRNNF